MTFEERTSSRPRTQLSRWRLQSVEGTHRWKYLDQHDSIQQPQSLAEKYFLGLPMGYPNPPPPQTFLDCARNGLSFYQSLQLEDGHWGCGYGGPSFLLPSLVFAMYISQTTIPPEWATEIIAYLAHHVNEDGGWGLHLAGNSTVFATTLYYVVLRILGLESSDPLAAQARKKLLSLGGAIGVPQWGKYWLSCLNLYDWDGVNPVPPELWLLPDWISFHPWRWWVHCRMVYLPASYLYANKCQIALNPLLEDLRKEIFVDAFLSINFSDHCGTVASSDIKRPPAAILKLLNPLSRIWDTYLKPAWLHEKANKTIRDLIQREDENTFYGDLAPVNKALQMAVVYFADGEQSTSLIKHREKLSTYFWMDESGMTCSGTDGVQVWDTAFTVLAVVEAGLAQDPQFSEAMKKALQFLDVQQLREDLSDPYRQKRKGGWTFSTKDNGYIVSDCSAESMKAVILLQRECGFPELISPTRLQDCVDSLLQMQNPNGGFGTFERTRGGTWLEYLNPAEVFDRIMIEYSYPECTTAVLTSLALFRRHFPDYRAREIESTISRAISYVLSSQRPDGSWYGAWAICFTYATFFALEALEVVHQTYQTSDRARRACDWLVARQKSDGGWGEHYSSCERQTYIQHEQSQVVNTAWAVLALITARYPHADKVRNGVQLIMSRQQPNGEWLQEDIEGVFGRTCMIGYPNYKFYFPIRALGKYEQVYVPWVKRHKGSTERLY